MKTCKKGLHQYDDSMPQCPYCARNHSHLSYLQNAEIKRAKQRQWHSDNPLYGTWNMMHQRCSNPKNGQFHNYGARGISVCAEWTGKQGYLQFVRDMSPRPGPEYSIDRKNNNLGYSKENCRWATRKEQGRNKRNNLNITYKGDTKTATGWSEVLGPSIKAISRRLKSGWPIEKAINDKPHTQRSITFNGETKTLNEWAAHIGLTPGGLRYRLNSGKWPKDECVSLPRGMRLCVPKGEKSSTS